MTKDPYKYFRIEAGELLDGLRLCIVDFDRNHDSKNFISRVLRLAHTLKGASRVVRLLDISKQAHAIEDILSPFRDNNADLPKSQVDQILSTIDSIAALLATIEQPARSASQAVLVHAPADEILDTVRVEIAEVDGLLRGITEVTTQVIALRKEVAAAEQARHIHAIDDLRAHLDRHARRLAAGISQVESELAQIYEAANHVRLLPVTTIVATLERAVREAANMVQKQATFELVDDGIRIDTHVLVALQRALLHVVRNAVVHGIETSAERLRTNKPEVGRIVLNVERVGDRIVFTCSDDGRGIDLDAVRRSLVNTGRLSPAFAASLGLQDAIQMLLQGGISTAATVTEVAGRGIGLDVLRETAALLKGEVTIDCKRGLGTNVIISVPASISTLLALQVEISGTIVSLPMTAVQETIRLREDDFAEAADRKTIVYHGHVIPFLPLAHFFRAQNAGVRTRKTWSAIVLESQGGLAAVGVDRLVGTSRIVVRPLPAWTPGDRLVAGATLDAEGNPQLVLNPIALVASVYGAKQTDARADQVVKSAPVLIIDDSLTTRMLEQSILESAGYEVQLATSAEEGLAKTQMNTYSLFLVDVEMPGMNGFEFVERVGADPSLRSVPAILVTSRNAPEDRVRGNEVGARAYIVKGEFDQRHLLKLVRELIG